MKIGTWNSSFLWNLIIHLLVLNTGNFREWSISSLVIIIPATPSNPSIPYVKTHQWVFMGIQLISQRFCIGTMMWVDHVEPHPYPTKILLKYQKIPYSRNSWICDIFFWEIYIYIEPTTKIWCLVNMTFENAESCPFPVLRFEWVVWWWFFWWLIKHWMMENNWRKSLYSLVPI